MTLDGEMLCSGLENFERMLDLCLVSGLVSGLVEDNPLAYFKSLE